MSSVQSAENAEMFAAKPDIRLATSAVRPSPNMMGPYVIRMSRGSAWS